MCRVQAEGLLERRAGAPGPRRGRRGGRQPVQLLRRGLQDGAGRALPQRLFVLYLAVAAICLGLLMLPLEGQPSRILPTTLHASLPQKLVAAYVLGLLTMAFLQG
ncbi:motile sperm domain-containing protein 3 [Sceloporus undulatus]|uniref:motile sperm domain-containing protein 3 n=1 Tax=Sceloporus undulatus TaxID=8520 RepID=UPI001C4C68B7|nr:motile sperm domain-containing protein 3 [Sceloporus undulatus]